MQAMHKAAVPRQKPDDVAIPAVGNIAVVRSPRPELEGETP
jgi:hypothetical protein